MSQTRVLFCIGVLPAFFEADAEERQAAMEAIPPAFDDLAGRFGITVLGTFDDDRLMVGPSPSWPWTSYILADVPDLDAAIRLCDVVRSTEVGEHRLWRYLRIEARVGRELFFGNA
ncbi:MAG: hypothetical protein IRZ32_00015 [Solirubrobacteraceae bacterium]|nr:hypothetical protein [Solirubrobacteraceae bacterium]